jgi:hypothetical protein
MKGILNVDTLKKNISPRGVLSISFFLLVILFLAHPWEYGEVLRYGFGKTIVLSFIIFSFTYSQRKRLFVLIGFLAVCAIFELTLFSLWKYGFGEMQVLGGNIYFSDTFLFLSESNNLLDGGSFISIAARRPLFPSFFSSLLLFSGRNLQVSLIVLVSLNAIAIYLVSVAIGETNGVAAAAMTSVMLFLFYRRFIGTPDTENYGILLGTVGFALLWTRYPVNRGFQNLFGLLLITLGLLGRAGAFFVILGILAWLVSIEKGYRRRIHMAALGISIILIGVLLNYFVYKVVSKPTGVLFANYSQTLYGISVGGKGWEQAYKDFPALSTLPENESSTTLYHLAWNNIIHNPLLALKGIAGSWLGFFSLKDESVFGFASGGELIFRDITDIGKHSWYIVWRIFLYCLSAVGIYVCIKHRDEPHYRLVLFCLLGTILSMPFLPPRDSALMRVYAGTITPIIFIPAIGMSALLPIPIHVDPVENPTSNQYKKILGGGLVWLGILLVFLSVFIPITGRHKVKLGPIGDKCANGLITAIVRVIPGSTLNLVNDGAPTSILPPFITSTVFKKSINNFPNKEIIAPLRTFPPPTAIANVVDIQSHEYYWLLVHKNLIISAPQLIWVCGAWNQDLFNRGLPFLEARNIIFIPEPQKLFLQKP